MYFQPWSVCASKPTTAGNLGIHKETRGCDCSLKEFLMMGIISPEICWASSMPISNKFYYWFLHLFGCFWDGNVVEINLETFKTYKKNRVSIFTSQEVYRVSVTITNRLMLIRDTIGVDFDNYTKQTFTFENNMKYRSEFRCKMQICMVL
jgi:hypothetical protein